MTIHIHESRDKVLGGEFSKPYFAKINQSIQDKKTAGEVVFPASQDIFAAYDYCPLDDLKVVILGQDPYHGVGQAHGLSFSVQEGVKIPPSLRNIFKEVESDLFDNKPPESALPDSTPLTPHQVTGQAGGNGEVGGRSGDLTRRADQGVFLLNSVLTVSQGQPASHSKIGRQTFTDATIAAISDHREGVVFLLRGNFAKSKRDLIDDTKHLILEAPHPSPFSAHTGFFGCKHFSQANEWLVQHGRQPIDR